MENMVNLLGGGKVEAVSNCTNTSFNLIWAIELGRKLVVVRCCNGGLAVRL